MSIATFDHCPSARTLKRIADARWTPYVADTLQIWSRNALTEPGTCASIRAGDCASCRALHRIVALRWSENLGERIQQTARDALSPPSMPVAATPVSIRASA